MWNSTATRYSGSTRVWGGVEGWNTHVVMASKVRPAALSSLNHIWQRKCRQRGWELCFPTLSGWHFQQPLQSGQGIFEPGTAQGDPSSLPRPFGSLCQAIAKGPLAETALVQKGALGAAVSRIPVIPQWGTRHAPARRGWEARVELRIG